MTLEQSLELLIATFGLSEGCKIEGRTRIQKEICNLQYEHHIPMDFLFHSYYYGPYSDDLAGIIGDLVDLKILREEAVEFDNRRARYDYILTEEGNELCQRMIEKLTRSHPQVVDKLRRTVQMIEQIDTPDLIDRAKKFSRMESTR